MIIVILSGVTQSLVNMVIIDTVTVSDTCLVNLSGLVDEYKRDKQRWLFDFSCYYYLF